MTNPNSPAEILNRDAWQLCQDASGPNTTYGVKTSRVAGALILDFAADQIGSVEAGVLLAKICTGGAVEIELKPISTELQSTEADSESDLNSVSSELNAASPPMWQVHVSTDHPLGACIGAQYAGWPISLGKYFAMCSGPIRMLRGKEAILLEHDLSGKSETPVGVLESSKLPTESVIKQIADECEISPEKICLCVARTASVPGSVQIVARSIETAMHKLHELKFDLRCIISGSGQAPMPPIPDDDLIALGWTNDSILYGASVELTVDCEDAAIESVIEQVPSCSSGEFGLPFIEIFKSYEYDFYKIDKMLFSPARIEIKNRRTGRLFSAGSVRNDILKSSFGTR